MSYHHGKLKRVTIPDIFNHGQVTRTHDSMHISNSSTQLDSFESSVSSMMTFKTITILVCSCNLLIDVL